MITAVWDGSANDLQAHLADLEQRLQGSRVLRAASTNLHALIVNRIQQRGELTNGQKIGGGKYSTKELKSFGTAFNFEGLATKRQKSARTRNENDYVQFDGGYKEFRESLGRQTAYIDLTLTGGMLNTGFNVVPLAGGEGYGLGFINDTEHDKYRYNTERFGEFILPSQAEIDLSLKDVINDTNDAIRGSSK